MLAPLMACWTAVTTWTDRSNSQAPSCRSNGSQAARADHCAPTHSGSRPTWRGCGLCDSTLPQAPPPGLAGSARQAPPGCGGQQSTGWWGAGAQPDFHLCAAVLGQEGIDPCAPHPNHWPAEMDHQSLTDATLPGSQSTAYDLILFGDSITEHLRGTQHGKEDSRYQDNQQAWNEVVESRYRTAIHSIGGESCCLQLCSWETNALPPAQGLLAQGLLLDLEQNTAGRVRDYTF